jgi:hypothetical protein
MTYTLNYCYPGYAMSTVKYWICYYRVVLMAQVSARNPFANPDEEYNTTRNWLCCLYSRSRNHIEVQDNGMTPEDIYNRLHLEATEELRVQRIEWLVNNCIQWDFITRRGTDKFRMTDSGNKFCSMWCSGVVKCSD